MKIAVALATLLAVGAWSAAKADDSKDLEAAMAWAKPVLGSTCDFASIEGEENLGDSKIYDIRYRSKGQDQDSPDQVFRLIRLFCMSGAYNVSFVFLTPGSEAGEYKLLSFAEPKVDYDYKDEMFTELVAPPRLVGYVTRSELVNADFDPTAGILSSDAKWRGLGDAWSSGEWRFVEGEFVLSRYEIDPTYDLNKDEPQQDDRAQPDSYVIYPSEKP